MLKKLVSSPRPLSPNAELEQFVKGFLKDIYDEAIVQQLDEEDFESSQAKHVSFKRDSSMMSQKEIEIQDVESPVRSIHFDAENELQ